MIQITTLKNGMRVVTDASKDVQTVSVGVWIGVGARFETAENNGISHVLEHMAFKGTATRSASQITREVEDVGGYMNAYTGHGVTAYYIKALKPDLKLTVDILADILQHSTIPADEWKKEKGVILQEINMIQDQPDDLVFEYFNKKAYPDQPLGRPVIGTVETVSAFTSEHILDYMQTMYQGSRMVVSASGAVKHDEFVKMCEERFVKITDGKVADPVPARFNSGDVRIEKKHEQVNLVMGFEGVSYNHPDYYAVSVLAGILGGGMSSRLFQEIREKRGLVYTVYAFHAPESDTGLFGVYAGTGEKQVAELMPVLCDEIVKIPGTMTDEEINRAKAKAKARILMKLENPATHAESNAIDLITRGRIVSQEELVQKIDAVDGQALARVAKQILGKKPVLATLGPIKNVMGYEDVCRRLKLS